MTLVCQEQEPEAYDFVDSVYDIGPMLRKRRQSFSVSGSTREAAGWFGLLIGGRLLTYVAGPFPPFEAVPFQDAPDEWIAAYAEANVRAMHAIFQRWPQDLVQANHAILQPWLVRQALAGSAPYVVTIHGSELNFAVKKDPRLIPYMMEGLDGAAAVVALSETSRTEVIGMAAGEQIDIESKTDIIPPGVDTGLFAPEAGNPNTLRAISSTIDPGA